MNLNLDRTDELRREAGALKIQKNFRRHRDRKSFLTMRKSAFILQTGLRSMIARNEFRFRKQTKAAIIIQAYWRCYHAYLYYKSHQKAVLVSQCSWRCTVARRELRKLKMAARETGALKAVKDKPEKRTDLEEAKPQEIAQLQDVLHKMQLQVEEFKSMAIKEREAARKAIEEAPPVIKETPAIVQDTDALVLKEARLGARRSQALKMALAWLLTEKQTAEEEKKAHAIEQAKNVNLTKKLEDAGKKADQLQDSVQRLVTDTMILEMKSLVDHYSFSRISYGYLSTIFGVIVISARVTLSIRLTKYPLLQACTLMVCILEEKLSNLESENQLHRQQALSMSPTGRALAARPNTTIFQRTPENGNVDNEEIKKALPNPQLTETEKKPQTSLN
ncbi:hypothetical protein F3Y22_tig00111769pilonHSYRG00496 [Hibiscus syriacus]|uniref:Uncharacterized protein n=1 Tax=Hibiscus syriacus TaxID=106335 RepID=A0A6A2YG29_HIBSY|nr:hypothetical protein F3Y22_tig00111769pilonHSYRG00496 [Hibiscus syriacus]